jgi:putative ABC transport system permease protein
LAFAEPRSHRSVFEVARLPGVMEIEETRVVPVRLRAGQRSRTLAVTGLVERPRLSRVLDQRGEDVGIPLEGLVLSRALGEVLDVQPGDALQVEVLEGRRPIRDVTVALLVDDRMGLQAYMHVDAVRRLLRESETVSGVAVTIDPAMLDRFYAVVKVMPAVAGVALRDATLRSFRETIAEHMGLQIFINVIFAGIIAFGVVYNAARVSLSERSRELASLRVLGFTRREVSGILIGELAVIVVAALPVGLLIGQGLAELIVWASNSELFRFPMIVTGRTRLFAVGVVLASAAISSLIVRRRVDHLDLVAVLKVRE